MKGIASHRLFATASIAVLLLSTSSIAAQPPKPKRPAADDGATQVGVTAWFADVSRIDSASQTFTVNLFLLLKWKDPSLAHPGTELKSYALNEIWYPHYIVSNASGDLRNTLPETVDVAPDGQASFRQMFVGSFNQPLDLHRFPFDIETFTANFAILGSRPDEVALIPDPTSIAKRLPGAVGKNEPLTIPDWIVTGVGAEAVPYRLLPGTELAGYSVFFSASRRHQHYILKVLLPLLLIVCMAFSVFWIDPTLGASQISVAVTSMLTLIAYRFAIGADTPKLPYLTLMDAFILLGTLMVFFSLVEVMITTRLALTDRVLLARAIDRKCRLVFPALLLATSAGLYLFW